MIKTESIKRKPWQLLARRKAIRFLQQWQRWQGRLDQSIERRIQTLCAADLAAQVNEQGKVSGWPKGTGS